MKMMPSGAVMETTIIMVMIGNTEMILAINLITIKTAGQQEIF